MCRALNLMCDRDVQHVNDPHGCERTGPGGPHLYNVAPNRRILHLRGEASSCCLSPRSTYHVVLLKTTSPAECFTVIWPRAVTRRRRKWRGTDGEANLAARRRPAKLETSSMSPASLCSAIARSQPPGAERRSICPGNRSVSLDGQMCSAHP